MTSPPGKRTGRRPGDARSRERILAAARGSFAANGYDGTTIRGVADAAGVDPALVHYFFGTKDGLFAAVVDIPLSPAAVVGEVLDGGLDGLGERLARRFLEVWDDPATGPPLVGLIRGAASHGRSAAQIRDFVGRAILGRLAAALDGPDAELRADLCGAQLVGTAMLRYVLLVEPMASAPAAEVVGWLGPTLQRYLTGALPAASVGP
jgi:AcrR family transcriptional regulator